MICVNFIDGHRICKRLHNASGSSNVNVQYHIFFLIINFINLIILLIPNLRVFYLKD